MTAEVKPRSVWLERMTTHRGDKIIRWCDHGNRKRPACQGRKASIEEKAIMLPTRKDLSMSPIIDPLYSPPSQLLMPHIRYTMEINTRARTQLISDGGIFDKVSGAASLSDFLPSLATFKIPDQPG